MENVNWWKSEKRENPLLNLPPKRGEKQRGDFALSTKGKRCWIMPIAIKNRGLVFLF